MNRILQWLQILSAVAMIVGIALVILQLQQNEKLVRFQIAADLVVRQDNSRNTILGEEFSTTIAKLQLEPDALTDEEIVELENYAMSLVLELAYRRELNNAGIFKGSWKDWLWVESCMVFNNPVGKNWLALMEDIQFDAELIEELKLRNERCGPTLLQKLRSG